MKQTLSKIKERGHKKRLSLAKVKSTYHPPIRWTRAHQERRTPHPSPSLPDSESTASAPTSTPTTPHARFGSTSARETRSPGNNSSPEILDIRSERGEENAEEDRRLHHRPSKSGDSSRFKNASILGPL